MGRSLYQLRFDERVRTMRSGMGNVDLGGGQSLQVGPVPGAGLT